MEFAGKAAPTGSLHTADEFNGLYVQSNPPANLGSDLQAGHQTSRYKDGVYAVRLYTWQFYHQDAQHCPSGPAGSSTGQHYGLYQEIATDTFEVKGGVITSSVIHKEPLFIGCISSSQTGQYPRWRPENPPRRTGGSAGVGVRD